MTQAQPLIQTLPMTLGAPMSDDPSNPTAIEIPLQIELPNGQTLFAAVALGGLPFDGQRQIAERMAAAWNAFAGVTTEEIKAPVKCLHQIAEPAVVHPDDVAVDALAALMKAKLAKQREKGYGGWDTDCTQERLSELLRQHVDKGDPVDVANFCAFLLARGEGIALPEAKKLTEPSVKPADVEAAIATEHYYTGQIAAETEGQHRALGGIMNCTFMMKNGHLVNGEALLQDLNKPDPERAMASARRRAFDKAYDMVVYAERERIAATQPAAQGLDAPWGDLKVAFGCDDTDALWAALDAGILIFPKGWKLVETDGSCARSVAIFRVDHAPCTAEGIAVKAVIDAALAAQAKQGGAA